MKQQATTIAALFALIQLAFLAGPVSGQEIVQPYESVRTIATESWVEEWDPATGQWVKVSGDDAVSAPTTETRSAARYAQPAFSRGNGAMLAQYGPFIVTSVTSASMIGSTDSASPAQFDAMLRDFPQLTTLQMVEAPGTSNDIANLAVGRRIREAGIATHVPNGGSVRSGAVELFLAGATRTMEQGAQFAVHSWLDNHGREADDFAAEHSAHRLYIDYYVEMGMSEARARDFYAMTNSVPHSSALWLSVGEMRPWLHPSQNHEQRGPVFRLAAPRPEVAVASQLHASEPLAGHWKVELEPVIVPALSLPILDYVDLSTITLAQLDLNGIGQDPLPA